MADIVLQHLEKGLLTITLNVPERRNALSGELSLALLKAAQRGSEDPDIRAVLLTGAGGTFSVGGDVKNMANPSAPPVTFETKLAMMRRVMEIPRLFYRMAKPVVAAVEGAAAGAGLSLALACDFRIVSESAKITTAFAKIGTSGDYGNAYFLTKIVGGAKAREALMLSPVMSGKEAHAFGMMTRVVPDDDVQASAKDLALTLARGPTIAFGYMKKNIASAEQSDLDGYLDGEAFHHCRCLQTEDYKEATSAFVRKRKPEFSGR